VKDLIGVHAGYKIKPASEDKDYTGMKVEMEGITGTVEYTDVHDGLALRFRGEHGFMDLTPGGIKIPRFEIDDIRMWIYMRQLQEGTWDVFDEKIGLGAQADTPSEAIKLYLEKLRDNDFVGRGYLSQVGITEDTRMIGEFNKCKNIINIEMVLKYNELLKKEEREDMAMKGGEQEPTLDVLFVFFNIKDINGEPVPHFMVPSLTSNNAYIMEEGCDDTVSLVKKALGDYKLSAGDMEYLGWEGDTPPRITKENIKDIAHIDDRLVDDWLLVTRKVLEFEETDDKKYKVSFQASGKVHVFLDRVDNSDVFVYFYPENYDPVLYKKVTPDRTDVLLEFVIPGSGDIFVDIVSGTEVTQACYLTEEETFVYSVPASSVISMTVKASSKNWNLES